MAKIRVLLADDHETVRKGLQSLIDAQPDMEVVGEASDGGHAAGEARRLSPDVVVVDLAMPGGSGLKAIETLRADCPGVHVLVLTRHSPDGYLEQVLHLGGLGYVLKQSAPAEFLDGIRAVAAGQPYLDRAATAHFVDQSQRRPRGLSDGARLSPREAEVLRLVARGHTNKDVAVRLGLSVKTVESHKAKAMGYLGMTTRVQLVQFAHVQGWLDQES